MKNLFSGRLGIADTWVGSIVGGIIFAIAATIFPPLIIFEMSVSGILIFVLFFIFIASLLIRRLHDLNKSGWWALLSFIPGINAIFWVYLSWWKGNKLENKYGSPSEKIRLSHIFGFASN